MDYTFTLALNKFRLLDAGFQTFNYIMAPRLSNVLFKPMFGTFSHILYSWHLHSLALMHASGTFLHFCTLVIHGFE